MTRPEPEEADAAEALMRSRPDAPPKKGLLSVGPVLVRPDSIAPGETRPLPFDEPVETRR